MAKANKMTAENEETLVAPTAPTAPSTELSPEAQAAIDAKNNELAALAEEETQLKARMGEIIARRRELGVTRVVNRGPRGVGDYVKDLIKAGKTNEEIMALVKENFPQNNTNVNCVNWYRNALKQWPDGKRPGKKAEAGTQASADAPETEQSAEAA